MRLPLTRRAATLALLGLLSWGAPALAQVHARNAWGLDREEQPQQVLDLLGPAHVLREAWRTTSAHFWDKSALPAEWEQLRDRYQERVLSASSPEETHAVINAMLGELKVSHLALLERRVFLRELYNEFRAEPVVRAGLELAELNGRLFVAALADAGPADAAGLRVGDELVAIDGRDPRDSGRLDPAGHDPALDEPPAWFLRVEDEQPLRLGVRRAAGAAAEEVVLQPRPTSLVESSARSARVVEQGGVKVGVVRLWHFMTLRIAEDLRAALTGPLAEADVLVLDVRGRGGSDAVVRRVIDLVSGRRAVWTRPVVVLTDRGTRSAKEIFAWRWKKLGRGPILGERTAGACIGCTFHQLSDGSVLMVPVTDVRRLTGGVTLEGVGVEPDEVVQQLPLPYRGGQDAILSAGLRRAADLARTAPLDRIY